MSKDCRAFEAENRRARWRVLHGALELVAFFACFAAIMLLLSCLVRAHEAPGGWQYPNECCHNLDCAPIEKWVPGKTPSEPPTITTKHGEAKLDPEQLRDARQSPDGQSHACYSKSWVLGTSEPHNTVRSGINQQTGKVAPCLWLPPSL